MNDLERNPWKTLDSKVVYKNPWISVREDKVICPDGSEGIYGVVDSKRATAVVALTPDREVYLVGQYRYPIDRYSWEIIEGGVEPGESPLAACKRELEEEAGLQAEKFVPLGGETHLSNCFTSERSYLYLATELRPVQSRPDNTEILQVKKVPLSDALRMCDSGEISDGLSLIGLMLTDRMLNP